MSKPHPFSGQLSQRRRASHVTLSTLTLFPGLALPHRVPPGQPSAQYTVQRRGCVARPASGPLSRPDRGARAAPGHTHEAADLGGEVGGGAGVGGGGRPSHSTSYGPLMRFPGQPPWHTILTDPPSAGGGSHTLATRQNWHLGTLLFDPPPGRNSQKKLHSGLGGDCAHTKQCYGL